MDKGFPSSKTIICYVLLCIFTSALLYVALAQYTKSKIINQFQGVTFVVDANAPFKSELFYTFGNEFNSKHKINDSHTHKDTLSFVFEKKPHLVKKFRLDFGTNTNLKTIKIKKIILKLGQDNIIIKEEGVFKSLFLNSVSTELDKANGIIYLKKDEINYDPYIIFKPLARLVISKPISIITFLAPFFILMVFLSNKVTVNKSNIALDIIFLLFVVCIPLKIAWTTFIALVLCLYGLINLIKNKKFNYKNPIFLLFVAIFIIQLLFGRPESVQKLSKSFVLLLFAFISGAVKFGTNRTFYKIYSCFFIVLNSVIISAAIGFLVYFKEFYGLDISDFFLQIKTYSGSVRNWMFYDHAAFLSFFGLVGFLFIHQLYQEKAVAKELYLFYGILLFLFIIIVGARVSLIIFGVFILNFFLKFSSKIKHVINFIIYILCTIGLLMYIQKLDYYRYHLWSVSWQAIKEKPWFGFGLGNSEIILQNETFIKNAGFVSKMSFNHSHNQIITSILEVGALGAGCIFIIFIIFLIKTKLYESSTFMLFLFGLGFIFLTESILLTSKPLFVICFLFVIISSNTNKNWC